MKEFIMPEIDIENYRIQDIITTSSFVDDDTMDWV